MTAEATMDYRAPSTVEEVLAATQEGGDGEFAFGQKLEEAGWRDDGRNAHDASAGQFVKAGVYVSHLRDVCGAQAKAVDGIAEGRGHAAFKKRHLPGEKLAPDGIFLGRVAVATRRIGKL